ncbi:MAG: hypothetical protein PWP23_2091 [Candidatus Sumerlaeota bacterium]|nr:hypothetical protein [Candidatus Sumerlaeota bacterium]
MPRQIILIHGNSVEKVGEKRYALQQELLPNGEEDGEIADIQSAGNQGLTLDSCVNDIIEELGTVSLIPDARRIVVVHDLADFKSGGGRRAKKSAKKSAKKAAKPAKQRASSWQILESFLLESLPETPNTLIFVYNEDEEKFRWLDKKSELYTFCQRHGDVFEFSDARIDWRFEDAVLAGDLNTSLLILREWADRSGSPQFRVLQTFNRLLQWLLQARLREEARESGANPHQIDLPNKKDRLSLDDMPPFKQKKVSARARFIPTDRLLAALQRLVVAQKAFFPTGEERVVPDAWDVLEELLVELLRPQRT